MHSREGPAAGAGVGKSALGRRHNPAGGNDHDVLWFPEGRCMRECVFERVFFKKGLWFRAGSSARKSINV